MREGNSRREGGRERERGGGREGGRKRIHRRRAERGIGVRRDGAKGTSLFACFQ